MKTALPHAAWALVAIGTYFVGAKANSPPERLVGNSALAQGGTSGERPSHVGEHSNARTEVLSALPKSPTKASQADAETLIEKAHEVSDALSESQNPLADFDALDPDLRKAAGRGTALILLSEQIDEMAKLLARENLIGISDRDADRVLELRVAAAQLMSKDPRARRIAGDRMNLSEEEFAEAEEDAIGIGKSRNMRNAQNLASVYSASIAAGADYGDATTPAQIAAKLAEGVFGGAEMGFDTTTFKVPLDDPAELESALEHISGDFSYTP